MISTFMIVAMTITAYAFMTPPLPPLSKDGFRNYYRMNYRGSDNDAYKHSKHTDDMSIGVL